MPSQQKGKKKKNWHEKEAQASTAF